MPIVISDVLLFSVAHTAVARLLSSLAMASSKVEDDFWK